MSAYSGKMDRFVVKKRRLTENQSGEHSTSSSSQQPEHRRPEGIDEQSTFTLSGTKNVSFRDIGLYLRNKDICNDQSKYEILTNHWAPDKCCKFPTSSHFKRGRKEQRRVNLSHFEKYPWLVFWEDQKGLFCKYCTVFCYEKMAGGQGTVSLKKTSD